jgi:hypothetical protein
MKHYKRNISLAYKLWIPKCDSVYSLDVVLEMIDVVQNQTLGLALGIVTYDLLID